MVKANTGLLPLYVLVLGAACAPPVQDASVSSPAPSSPRTTPRALGEGPAAQVVDVGTSADNALAPRAASLTAAGNAFLFSADDGSTGRELWRLTPVGPALIKDIAPGTASASPSQLFYSRGLTWFSATNGQQGLELWRTDGTTAGTLLIKDIQPGAASSRPANFAEFNGWVFFSANDGSTGNELWRTDGTSAGTLRIEDLYLGGGDGDPRAFTEMNGALYFTGTGNGGTRQLWRTNGQPLGAVRLGQGVTVSPEASGRELARLNNVLFFVGDDGSGGLELWKTDGTEAGTVRVKDVRPGAESSQPTQLTAMGNAVYFVANDGTTGRELWRTDGTEAGTQRVLELTAGYNLVETPDALTAAPGRLYFRIKDTSGNPSALYVTDGTAAGTQRLVDFKGALGGRGPLELKVHDNTLYFTGSQTVPVNIGIEVWTSNGTTATTRRLGNNLLPDSSTAPVPGSFTSFGDTVYFTAIAPGTGLDPDPAVPTLWQSRGDLATTRPVGSDLVPPPTRGANPVPFVPWNGDLYFTSFEPYAASQLWRTRGSAATTASLATIVPRIELQFSATQGLTALTPMGGALYFAALSKVSTGYQLWKTGGTTATTAEVTSRVSLALYDYPRPIELTEFKGAVYFAGRDATHGVELWRSDGTDAGTVLVKDLVPGSQDSIPLHLLPLGDALYFVAQDAQGGRALWKTDGSEAGTVLVADIRDVGDRSAVVSLAGELHGWLYFVAAGADTGSELWKTDGTSVTRVTDIAPGAQDSGPDHFVKLGDFLYFTANDGTTGEELWRTDGTTATRVRDIRPGAGSSEPRALTPLGLTLYFTANDGTTGAELWKTDGSEAGTTRVKDILPGARGGVLAESLFALETEQLLLFAANDDVYGTELWRSDGTEAGTFLLHDIAPWQLGSEPSGFTVYGDAIVFNASNGRHGHEPWSMPRARLTNSTPPRITCPANQVVEAQQALGSPVTFAPATATDDDPSLPPAISYDHESGGFFLYGDTTVVATARDSAGLVDRCSFRVTVRDSLPPEVFCPSNLQVEAMNVSGATVTFPAPRATDTVTHNPALSISHPSGTVFPQGSTEVVVRATDDAGNSNQCTFSVTVRDTQVSMLTCPADRIVEAENASGAPASWPAPEASDTVSAVDVSVDHTSGDRFPLGTTPVRVTARDAAGNVATCTFRVVVQDTTAPLLRCPAPLELEALGPSGAPADFLVTNVVDSVSPVTVTTEPASGATFPVGETSVRVLGRDAAGNQGECRFAVRVVDTLPPLLTCPQTVTVAEGPVAVTLPTPSATDRVTTAPELTLSPSSGSVFQPGDTPVEVTARDAAGNSAQCTFTVHVEKARSGCSAASSGADALSWLGLLALLGFAARRGGAAGGAR